MKISFDWDESNIHKSYIKHGIHYSETESVFEDEFKEIRLIENSILKSKKIAIFVLERVMRSA